MSTDVYMLTDDSTNTIKHIEVQCDTLLEIYNEMDKNSIIIPTNKDWVYTDEIIVTIGYPLDKNYIKLNGILLHTDNDRIITSDDVLEITSEYRIDTVESTKELTNIVDTDEGYILTYVNPLVLHIKLKEAMNIKRIEISMTDVDSYQLLRVHYINQSEELDPDMLGQKMLIEACPGGWHPDNKIYEVDFTYIKGRKYILKEDPSLGIMYKDIDMILQDFVKKNELELLFMQNYNKFVKDVADRVVKILTGLGRKY